MKRFENKVAIRADGSGNMGPTVQKLANERAMVFCADIDEVSFSKKRLTRKSVQNPIWTQRKTNKDKLKKIYTFACYNMNKSVAIILNYYKYNVN